MFASESVRFIRLQDICDAFIKRLQLFLRRESIVSIIVKEINTLSLTYPAFNVYHDVPKTHKSITQTAIIQTDVFQEVY